MRKVYVVVGMTGEYSDGREWFVAAYLSEMAAANRVRECQLFANDVFTRRDEQWNNEEKWSALLKSGPDPSIQLDYTGTHYQISAVDLVDG